MIRTTQIATRTVLLTLALLAVSAAAHAALIPVLNPGSPTPSGGNFIFSYNIDLQQDERVDPVATTGVTCPGPSGTRVQCNPTGTFVTIYDIPGFVSASTGAGWFAQTQLLGITPSNVVSSPFDSPSLTNVTFFYTGPVVHSNGSIVHFTGFLITSTLGGTQPGNFSFQATKDTGDAAGNTDQGSGPTTVPGPTSNPNAVPEPSTMMLLGGGFALLGFGKRLFRKF